MNRDGIPNATGEEWEYISEGPDHSKIRSVYEQDPDKWELWFYDGGWFPVGKGERNLGWTRRNQYRMKRRPAESSAKGPKWDKVDPVNNPSHYTAGGIECVDAEMSCLTPAEFRGACKAQAIQYIWREGLKGGDEDLRKAIWWLRMIVGDDPRKDREEKA